MPKSETRFEQVPVEKALNMTKAAVLKTRVKHQEGNQSVNLAFDLFRIELDGNVWWLEAIESLKVAKARVQQLGTAGSRYIVLDQRSGHKTLVEYLPDQSEALPWR